MKRGLMGVVLCIFIGGLGIGIETGYLLARERKVVVGFSAQGVFDKYRITVDDPKFKERAEDRIEVCAEILANIWKIVPKEKRDEAMLLWLAKELEVVTQIIKMSEGHKLENPKKQIPAI